MIEYLTEMEYQRVIAIKHTLKLKIENGKRYWLRNPLKQPLNFKERTKAAAIHPRWGLSYIRPAADKSQFLPLVSTRGPAKRRRLFKNS